MAVVKIENDYSCGRATETVDLNVRNPLPGETAEAWWDEVVYPLTGDGHVCGETDDAIYIATIVEIDDPELSAGDVMEWGL